jgi:hypothetical protein
MFTPAVGRLLSRKVMSEKQTMPSLESITFDTTGLSFQGDKNGVRVWYASSGDGLGLYYFPVTPDISADINSLISVRSFYGKQVASAGAGVISIDTLDIDGCKLIKMIIRVPQQPSGVIYLGSLTLPFKDFSFVVKMQCAERGSTGIRETLIMDELLKVREVRIDSSGKIEGWFQDPYDPTASAMWMMNKAESDKYDIRFPEHPLSILRQTLRQIESLMRISEEVKKEPKFIFSQNGG